MNFVHADVFFFVSSVAFIIIAAVLTVVLVYTVSILRDIKHLSKRVRKEGDDVLEDIKAFRIHIKEEGMKISRIGSFVSSFFLRKKKPKTSPKHDE